MKRNMSYRLELPKAVAQLKHEYTHSVILVFKPMNWLQRKMIAWCFGLKYEKLGK